MIRNPVELKNCTNIYFVNLHIVRESAHVRVTAFSTEGGGAYQVARSKLALQ